MKKQKRAGNGATALQKSVAGPTPRGTGPPGGAAAISR